MVVCAQLPDRHRTETTSDWPFGGGLPTLPCFARQSGVGAATCRAEDLTQPSPTPTSATPPPAPRRQAATAFRRNAPRAALVGLAAVLAAAAVTLAGAGPAGAATRPQARRLTPAGPRVARADAIPPAATTAAWCTDHGSSLAGWSGTFPDLPLCGPGPDYGGTWAYVVQPGPDGSVGRRYYNATPGFQCVELADRWLAVGEGLAPVLAEGSQVAMNYHAAYPGRTELVLNGSAGAVDHPPVAGDVISFSEVADFQDPTDGHVAVVVASQVDGRSGDGVVEIAQQNVAPGAMRRDLLLEDWRLVDPEEPPNAEWQYPYAAWLHVRQPLVEVVTPAMRAAIDERDAALAPLLTLGGSSSTAARLHTDAPTPLAEPRSFVHLGPSDALLPVSPPAPSRAPEVLLLLAGAALTWRVLTRGRRRRLAAAPSRAASVRR